MPPELDPGVALLGRCVAVALGLALGGLFVLAYWTLAGGVR